MSAAYENLRVYKAAKDMTAYFEMLIRGFERYHKYQIGVDIRRDSYAALILIAKANIRSLRENNLRLALDKLLELKIKVDICAEIKAYRNPHSYAVAARKVSEVSKQCEGWLRSCENPGRQEKPAREPANRKSLGAFSTSSSGMRKQEMVPKGSVSDGHYRH